MCVVSKRIVAIKMILGDCNLNAISRNLASEHPLLVWHSAESKTKEKDIQTAERKEDGSEW